MGHDASWPTLEFAQWAPTKNTLHMYVQILGKTRLALVPAQPEWLHARLFLDSRGFATGPMPVDSRVATIRLDVFDSCIYIETSDGRRRTVSIENGRCVADVWKDYSAALEDLGIPIDIWEKPQEVSDETPFSQNRHDCTFIAQQAQDFHRILTSVNAVFEAFRSQFFGRSGIQFWWGSFDLTVLLFNGHHEIAPQDKGYIMRYDLDAQHLNAGFWPGDDTAPAAFYAYLVPQYPDCATAPVYPESAGWVQEMGEWMMPYESVRTSENPEELIGAFLDSIYAFAQTQPGWETDRYTYVRPLDSDRETDISY